MSGAGDMNNTAITVETAAGTVVLDLSWIVAEWDFGYEEPVWAGPVGITFAGRTGAERWNGASLSDTGVDELDERISWPAIEEAIADAIDAWGSAPMPRFGEMNKAASCDDYRAALRSEEARIDELAAEESERLAA